MAKQSPETGEPGHRGVAIAVARPQGRRMMEAIAAHAPAAGAESHGSPGGGRARARSAPADREGPSSRDRSAHEYQRLAVASPRALRFPYSTEEATNDG